jgi:carbon-monoxide dehydrogenase medium subunit
VIPGQFEYVRPADLGEALRILKEREGEAKVLSGGHSLLPLLKLRLAQPALLVDIKDVAGLDGIVETDDDLRIGARVTNRAIYENALIAARYPTLHDAAGTVGDPQVRNWGTVGGECAHADPAADIPAVLIATRATIACRDADGERNIAAREFFLDTFQTALRPTEILTEIRIPRASHRSGGAYAKIERKAGDFGTAGAAVHVVLDADFRIVSAGVGLSAVAEASMAATAAEVILVGQMPSEDLFRRAGDAAGDQCRPSADVRGSIKYKRAMAAEMTVRALRRAVARARGEG